MGAVRVMADQLPLPPPLPSAARQLLGSGRFARARSEMAWVVLGQAMAALGGMAGIRAVTEVLTPDRYGELALGITLGTLGQLVAWSPISGAVLRYFSPAQESQQLRAYLDAVRSLLVRATVVLLALGAVVVAGLVAAGAGRWTGLALAALVFTLVSGYEAALDSMQLASRQRPIVAWHQAASVCLRFLMALVVIWIAGPSSTMAMVGYAAGVLLVLASQLFFFRQRVLPLRGGQLPTSESDSAALAHRMMQYAWPIAAWGVFSWTQSVSDRWILQGFTGTAVVGLYSAVSQVGFYPMTLFSAVTLQFSSPVLFAEAGDGSDPRRLQNAVQLVVWIVVVTLVVTAMATIVTLLFHHAIFGLLVGESYRSASRLLPMMVAAGGLFAAGQGASQVLLVAGSTKPLIAPKGAIAVLTLGLYAIGARVRGLDGVVYANVVFGMVYFLWMTRLAVRWHASVLRPTLAAIAKAATADGAR